MDFGFERWIAEFGFFVDPGNEGRRDFNLDPASSDFGPFLQPFERFDQRRKTVDTPTLRIEVDEFRSLTSILADRLQFVVVDNVGNEAFFVLEFHRVERTTIGIDADEEFLGGSDLVHGCCVLSENKGCLYGNCFGMVRQTNRNPTHERDTLPRHANCTAYESGYNLLLSICGTPGVRTTAVSGRRTAASIVSFAGDHLSSAGSPSLRRRAA